MPTGSSTHQTLLDGAWKGCLQRQVPHSRRAPRGLRKEAKGQKRWKVREILGKRGVREGVCFPK